MNFTDLKTYFPRRITSPLLGAPGTQLTGESLGTTIADPQLHIRTIQTLVDMFRPDIVWPMMDLTIESGALGAPVRFDREAPPSVSGHPLKTPENLEFVRNQEILRDPRVQATLTAVQHIAGSLTIPTGAYVGGPFTVAGQLMGVSEAALLTMDDPEFLAGVLDVVTTAIERYAQSLIEVGAGAIVILEPSAVMLSPNQFNRFSGDYVKRLVDNLPATTILHVCGNSRHLVDKMVQTGVAGLSLDAVLDFGELAQVVPHDVILVGNIDPVHTMVEDRPAQVALKVWNLLEQMADYENFILSTACDLPPETPLENIRAFMDTATAWNLRQSGVVTNAWESRLPFPREATRR